LSRITTLRSRPLIVPLRQLLPLHGFAATLSGDLLRGLLEQPRSWLGTDDRFGAVGPKVDNALEFVRTLVGAPNQSEGAWYGNSFSEPNVRHTNPTIATCSVADATV
jgi:hypothetical protein